MLDIGGEVGALVVYLAAEPPTGELEACPVDDPAARFHTGVHHRDIGHGLAWTAVFPEVLEGSYHLLDDDGAPLAHRDRHRRDRAPARPALSGPGPTGTPTRRQHT